MKDENVILRNILEVTATLTGKHFFKALVENLAIAVKAHSAWFTEYVPATRQLHALAFWSNNQISEGFFIDIDGTPCEKVIESTEIIHYGIKRVDDITLVVVKATDEASDPWDWSI
jgi:hypothetical protein